MTKEEALNHTSTIIQETEGFVLTCMSCGVIGSATDLDMAKLLGRFHENAFQLAAIAKANT